MSNYTSGSQRVGGSFLGFPLEGFGLFTSLLLTVASGFLAFFLVTALSIFGLLGWNLIGHHSVNYANSYLFFGFPTAVAVWTVALLVFGSLWIRAKITAK
ncbi:hypothetical protein [Acidicapsa ligni]|uniref:hypothetical protein n=1 Tax=Acidicapsa ligni TaxID=542300 RepID=UPI0021E00332|nr:hypothetical protein [Acidicapsa ligni]